jgi:hypothetical protein
VKRSQGSYGPSIELRNGSNSEVPISFRRREGNIVPWRTGLYEKNLAQSETLCTWRSSSRGTWEVLPVPGLVPGRLGKAIAARREKSNEVVVCAGQRMNQEG